MTAVPNDSLEVLPPVRCYYCSGTGKQGTRICITCDGKGSYNRTRPIVAPLLSPRDGRLTCWACLGARQCGACQGSRVKPDGTPCSTCNYSGTCDVCLGEGDLSKDDPSWTTT